MNHALKVEGEWGLRELDCGANEVLLDAMIRQGLPVAYCCRAGLCGMCKAVVLDGQVERSPSSARALSDEDVARGEILTCCARPRSDCSVRPLSTLQDGSRPQGAVVQVLSEPVAESGPWRVTLDPSTPIRQRAQPGQWAWLHSLEDGAPAQLACCTRAGDSPEFAARHPVRSGRFYLDAMRGTAIDFDWFAHPVAIVLDAHGLPLLRAIQQAAPAAGGPPAALLVLVGCSAAHAATAQVARQVAAVDATPDGEAALRRHIQALASSVAAGQRARVLARGASAFQARLRTLLPGTGVRPWDVNMENDIDLASSSAGAPGKDK